MNIEELKQTLEAATPGPWTTAADPSHYDSQSEIYRVEDGEFVASTGGKWGTLEANARLIVAAVNNLPRLLKVVEAAEKALACPAEDEMRMRAQQPLRKALEEMER
jgi:hypothetical protein